MTFEPYLERWNLSIDGEPFTSMSGVLLPVRQRGVAAMLKISRETEEQAGGRVMLWWNGDGAAPVLAHDDEALLMVRARGPSSLVQMARSAHDDDATRILCATAARLHKPRAEPRPALVPLTRWFDALLSGADSHGGIFTHSARTARELLTTQREPAVLHGDIHHANVLDFGPSGWLAIDPKGLYGERGFDYANIFCNPDEDSALAPGVFARRVALVATLSGIEERRLLQWIFAWTGLSAIWMLEDGHDTHVTPEVGKLAASALGIVV